MIIMWKNLTVSVSCDYFTPHQVIYMQMIMKMTFTEQGCLEMGDLQRMENENTEVTCSIDL